MFSPRPGRFPGYIKVINEHTDHAVFYGQMDPTPLFPDAGDLLPLDLPINIHFPEAGRYTIQIWFFQETTADVLKMEQQFFVFKREE